MSRFKRMIAMCLAILTMVPCIAFPASAKNVCSVVSGKTQKWGGVSTTFYVTTSNTKTHYVKMSMKKGLLVSDTSDALNTTKRMYDCYEILVYGKNPRGEWIQVGEKKNVFNDSSYKIKFSGYTEYKVKIWSWKTETINKVGGYIMVCPKLLPWCKTPDRGVYWKEIPTWSISKTSGVTLCK